MFIKCSFLGSRAQPREKISLVAVVVVVVVVVFVSQVIIVSSAKFVPFASSL